VTDAREEILRRVHAALVDVAVEEPISVPRDYRREGARAAHALVDLLAQRLEEYGAEVTVSPEARGAVGAALARRGARSVVVPPDLPAGLRPDGVELVVDQALDPLELDACDAVVTTCAAACAETGTLALDGGPGQGRRAVTLVPDLHICVVRADQIVETVPELFDRLAPSAREGRPIVLVSGPSATSDIELTRVEGVHGPRQLVVVISS
jgi:L-lactate dehydrogenase complex protein LldG